MKIKSEQISDYLSALLAGQRPDVTPFLARAHKWLQTSDGGDSGGARALNHRRLSDKTGHAILARVRDLSLHLDQAMPSAGLFNGFDSSLPSSSAAVAIGKGGA
jgi:hypothetical protein